MTIRKTDDWTTVINTSPSSQLVGFTNIAVGVGFYQMPPEVVQKYGLMSDWRNSVGTGPYMLTDFVSGASATLIRNPDYWDKDPVGPGKGNQLPYIDTVKMLIITDVSTRIAAIRTGRIDWVNAVSLDDAKSLKKTTPSLKSNRFLPDTSYVIGMRTDKLDLPFKDKRVRQALMLATDFQSFKDDLWGGEAEILVWPTAPVKGVEQAYIPLAELPADVKELYSYNPDKAKQLLADAGYPKGFKTKVMVSATPVSDVDYLSAMKSMWAKVGVDLTLDIREFGAYTAIGANFDEMALLRGTGIVTATSFSSLRATVLPSTVNPSRINDPKVTEAEQNSQKYFLANEAKSQQIFRELIPYVLSGAFVIPRPTPYQYTFWWPWIKNYHGELNIVYRSEEVSWIPFVWIDQDLREKMTGSVDRQR